MDVYEKISAGDTSVDDSIVLDHIQREKGRIKTISTKGVEVRLFLERGQILQRGEILRSSCGKLLEVELAKEPVVTAYADSWDKFSCACYHLGNRHARIQIGDRWLRFAEDSVLVELVEYLGLRAEYENAEFQPESGAYGHGHAGKVSSHNYSENERASHSHEHSHTH